MYVVENVSHLNKLLANNPASSLEDEHDMVPGVNWKGRHGFETTGKFETNGECRRELPHLQTVVPPVVPNQLSMQHAEFLLH